MTPRRDDARRQPGDGLDRDGGQLSTAPDSSRKRSACQGFSTQSANLVLANALRYALAGLPVFPLHGKAPAIAGGRGVYDASSDPETVAELWQRAPGAQNIGLALPAGHVGVDVDPRNGGTLAALGLTLDDLGTVAAETGGGGWHLIYRIPAGVQLESNIAGVDLKGAGGYLVVAPSIHPDTGRRYRWIDGRSPFDIPPAPMPDRLLKLFRKAPGRARATRTRQGEPSRFAEAFKRLLDDLGVDYSAGAGDQLVPCCFHDDRAPSLHVDPDRAVFFCFSPSCPARNGGRFRELAELARTQFGLVVDREPEETPTADTAHAILHAQLEQHGGDCAICGRSFFDTAVVGDQVRGRRRVMRCHRRDCGDWQAHRVEKAIMQARPWEWAGRFVSEHDPDEWKRLINGPLAERDDWLGAPVISGKIALFAGWKVWPAAVPVSFETMLTMAAERLLSIPQGKRLRRPSYEARAKRDGTAEIAVDQAATVDNPQSTERRQWTRWGFGLDLLSEVDVWTVLAIVEAHGGKVTALGSFSYPLARDAEIRAAVASRFAKPERSEISAFCRPAPNYASISPAPPLPEQPGYRRMSPSQQRFARLLTHGDANRASIEAQLARAA